MRLFRGVWRHGAGQLSEGEIEVSACVGFLHAAIAREGGGNGQLLLTPIDIGHGPAGTGLDEGAQPGRGAEDEPAVARLVAPRPRTERGQQRPVAVVRSYGQL